ncbi:MAG: hypothetical protein JKX72_11000 [Robiginitomaculum sp.]|nr:hypothetical protein [Robiginitomaculum sp.]
MASSNHAADKIAQAIIARKALPLMPTLATLNDGYGLQKSITAQINGQTVIGLKAGISSRAEQKHFGLEASLIASLYERGYLQNGCEIKVAPEQNLECEIGVCVNGQGQPKGIFPVVEVVRLSFSKPEDLSLANAVAVNLGADRFICGDMLPWDEAVADIEINMTKDGVNLMTASNDYALGAPINCAKWMINEARRRGLWQESEKDSLLLLGTCGQAQPAQAGTYCIDYGALGGIEFSISAMEPGE